MLWTYAVQTAAVVRNRCFNNRTKQTPYYMLTGRQPNIARMQKFGHMCYAYKRQKGKLDSRCERDIFVGYDKNSPAYMVYYPSTTKIQKHRLVEFVNKKSGEKQDAEDEFVIQNKRPSVTEPTVTPHKTETQDVHSDNEIEEGDVETLKVEHEDEKPVERRYPDRERKKPDYYGDSAYGFDITDIDDCYRLLCNVPQTYKEAVSSVNAKEWHNAMDEEMQALKDKVTFTLTTLPEGRYIVGGKCFEEKP